MRTHICFYREIRKISILSDSKKVPYLELQKSCSFQLKHLNCTMRKVVLEHMCVVKSKISLCSLGPAV